MGATVGYGVVVSVALALFASPLASSLPDGLERTAEALGFAGRATAPVLPAPVPGYEMPGVHFGVLATSLAGAAGTVVVFALAWWLARVLVPRPGRDALAGDVKPERQP